MDRPRSEERTDAPGTIGTADGESSRLTRREGEVLRLVASGRTDREIAAALAIKPRTVEWHVANVLRKLKVGSRTAAAAHAIRRGLD